MAWFEMLLRDRERLVELRRRVNVMPLGSAALAGTTFPIDRAFTARELGFDAVSENSLDAVSDRDFAIEFCSVASIAMMHLSRWSEELVLWSSQQFGFVDLPDRFCTGSSIMPQKKNPDVPELVRGKTGRVFGHLMGLLTLMKGQPLAYNKDNQEDKEPLFDALDTLKDCLTAMLGMLPHLDVRADRMREAASLGFATATDLADYLVRKDVPFRDAHEVVGRCVAHAVAKRVALSDLTSGGTAALQSGDRRVGIRRADARRVGQRAQPHRRHRAGAGPRGDRPRSYTARLAAAKPVAVGCLYSGMQPDSADPADDIDRKSLRALRDRFLALNRERARSAAQRFLRRATRVPRCHSRSDRIAITRHFPASSISTCRAGSNATRLIGVR